MQAHTKGLEEGGGASQPPQGQAGSGAGSKAVTASEGPSVEDEKEEERTQKPEPILPSECVQPVVVACVSDLGIPQNTHSDTHTNTTYTQ